MIPGEHQEGYADTLKRVILNAVTRLNMKSVQQLIHTPAKSIIDEHLDLLDWLTADELHVNEVIELACARGRAWQMAEQFAVA